MLVLLPRTAGQVLLAVMSNSVTQCKMCLKSLGGVLGKEVLWLSSTSSPSSTR